MVPVFIGGGGGNRGRTCNLKLKHVHTYDTLYFGVLVGGGGGEFQGTCKMSLGSEFDCKQSSAVCTYMPGLVNRHTYKL